MSKSKKEQDKEYYEKNKDAIKQRKKEWYLKNRIKVIAKSKEYSEKNRDIVLCKQKDRYANNKEKYKEKNANYRKLNKTKRNEYEKNKKKVDETYALKCKIRIIVSKSLKRNGFVKSSDTQQILGCTYEQFKLHLENQFQPWMNWQNRGLYNSTPNYGWDIDHIIPLATATCEADIIKLNHYTNLRPLCSKINRDIKRHN